MGKAGHSTQEEKCEALPCRDLLLWEVDKHARGTGVEAGACTPVIDLQPCTGTDSAHTYLLPPSALGLRMAFSCLTGLRERGRLLFTWTPWAAMRIQGRHRNR